MNVEVFPFDVHNIEESSSIAIIGRRRGGKTSLCRYLISQVFAKKYGRFLVMAGTKDCKVSYGDLIPDMFVQEFSMLKLKAVRDYQDELVARYNNQLPKVGRVCIILDDIGADKQIMNSEIIRDLYANSRHYGIMLVSLHQYIYQIAPANRANLDYVFLKTFGSRKMTRLFYDEFINIGNELQFSYIFQSSTSNLQLSCVIDNTKIPQKMSDCVFYFRQDNNNCLKPVFDSDRWEWCQSVAIAEEEVFSDSDSDNSDLSDALFEYETRQGTQFQVKLAKKEKLD